VASHSVYGCRFGPNIFPANDDGSTAAIPITSIFAEGLDFFGHTYTSLYINNNGNITFNQPSSTFTPFQISIPIIAPYFADVDTRGGRGQSTGGNATGSNLVYWNLDPVNHIFTATWDDVGYFAAHTNKVNAFQVQLIDEGNGDFNIEFRYQAINWTTGDFNGGSSGLGGIVSRAGFSAGDGVPAHFFELPQSGNQSAMLGLPTTPAPVGTLGAQPETGVYIFQVRNGIVLQSTIYDFVFTYNDGKDYYYGTVADSGNHGGYRDGSTATTYSTVHPVNGVSDGGAGLGSESGYFSVNTTLFTFTDSHEAVDPPPPATTVPSGAKSDLVLQNDSGPVALWEVRGTTVVDGAYLPDPGPSWHVTATGGFYSDGSSGVVLQNDSGAIAVWEMSGTSVIGGDYLPDPGPSWRAAAADDLYGDGSSSIVLQNNSGPVAVWKMNGTSIVGGGYLPNPGATWHLHAG
jgi:Nidogen-like